MQHLSISEPGAKKDSPQDQALTMDCLQLASQKAEQLTFTQGACAKPWRSSAGSYLWHRQSLPSWHDKLSKHAMKGSAEMGRSCCLHALHSFLKDFSKRSADISGPSLQLLNNSLLFKPFEFQVMLVRARSQYFRLSLKQSLYLFLGHPGFLQPVKWSWNLGIITGMLRRAVLSKPSWPFCYLMHRSDCRELPKVVDMPRQCADLSKWKYNCKCSTISIV